MGVRRLLGKITAAGEEDLEPVSRRVFVVPDLRPYLPSRAHLWRLARGLLILVGMGWKTARAALRRVTTTPRTGQAGQGREAAYDALERAGAAALVVAVVAAAAANVVPAVWSHVHSYAPLLSGVTLPVLLVAAWRVGPDQTPTAKSVGEPDEPDCEGDPAVPPLPQIEPLAADEVAHAVRQIAVPNGWRGAHLDDVLAHLPGRSRAELLTVLADARIPVTEQLKLRLPGGRQRNRQGVRLDHLPTAPDEAPAGPAATPPEAPVEAVPDTTPPVARLTIYGGR